MALQLVSMRSAIRSSMSVKIVAVVAQVLPNFNENYGNLPLVTGKLTVALARNATRRPQLPNSSHSWDEMWKT
jgi:hypothetical protein